MSHEDIKASLADVRREYLSESLELKDMAADPVEMFRRWLDDARGAQLEDYTAMNVATVSPAGMPQQRIVLLKAFDEKGFVFYTNLESRKAKHIAANNQVCLHFSWLALNRQVIINGRAEPISRTEAMKYFLSRPKDSQIGAWASDQSRPISTRALLEEKFQEFKHRFAKGEITMPKFWGGYRVMPEQFEFWQGRPSRLHDRFIYTPQQGHWQIERWQP